MNIIFCFVIICFVAVQAAPLKSQKSTPCWDRYEQVTQMADIHLPVCQEDGQYEAMQSTAFFFYCVNSATGEPIPDTAYSTSPRMGNPITQSICQDYSDLWSDFNQWFVENLFDETQETDEDFKTEQWRDYRATHANEVLRTHFEISLEELEELQVEESHERYEMPSEEA